MPQLLSLSRAARLVGVTRSAIQKKIQNGELSTFEGKLKVTELLRAYPNTQIDDTSMLERVKQIKNAATFKRSHEDEFALPSQNVLMARLIKLGKELIEVKSAFKRQNELLETINNKLAQLDDAHIKDLHNWLNTEIQRSPKLEPAAQLLATDTVLRIMAAQVKVIPSGHEFFVEGNDSILQAALRAGLAINYGCESGNCGACKARIVSGEVQATRNHDYVFTELEKQMNYQLLCSCTAITDLTIEAAEAHKPEDIPLQQIETKVKKLEQLNDNLVLLRLQTPRTNTLRFLAGQYVSLQFENETQIQAFIASCPCDGRNLEFHLNENVEINQTVKIEGPYGDFVLQEDSKRPALFITDEQGFSPIKSLIEHVIASDNETINHLYWISNDETKPYQHNLCRSWVDALDDFKYTQTKTINQIVTDYSDLSKFEVYIAGSENLISTAKEYLLNNYLPTTQCHIAKLRGNK